MTVLSEKITDTKNPGLLFPDYQLCDLETELNILSSEIKSTSLDLNILYTWANPYRKINESADLKDYFDRIPEFENKLRYFDIFQQTSAVILRSVELEELAEQNNFQIDIASQMAIQAQRFDRHLDFKPDAASELDKNGSYSNFEYILYKYLSTGAYPWYLIQMFEENLTSAVQKNPEAFWRMFRAFRLDKILPFFRKISDEDKDKLSAVLLESGHENEDGIKEFCQAMKKVGITTDDLSTESYGKMWPQTLYFMPHIQSLMDEGIPFERQNKPEIYMNIALALAYLALELESEPIAALVVKDGRIISGAHNEATKFKNIFIHAEDIAIHNAIETTEDENLSDCSIFVTAEPCAECATKLMKYQLSSIYIGIASEMGGETKFGILTSRVHSNQGPPYRNPYSPENITWGVLEEEFFHLYHEVMDWQDFVKPRLSLNFSIPLRQTF